MKNRKFAFIVLIIVAFSVIFFAVYQSYKKDEGRLSSEIYSKVLTYHSPYDVKNPLTDCLSHKRKLLISPQSSIHFMSRGKSWQELNAFNLPETQSSTWEGFLWTNSVDSDFPSHLSLGCEYTLVELKNYESVPESECPLIMLSKIGFNKTGNQALVLLSQTCGQNISLALFLLDLVDKQWQVTDVDSPPLPFTH